MTNYRAIFDNTIGQLSRLADEAYGTAVSTSDPAERAHAAAVEDVARWLLGEPPAPALQKLLNDADRKRTQRRG